MELIAGRIYQVQNGQKWVIAEYVKEIPAHSYKYFNLNMMTCTTSAEMTRKVPTCHQWKKIGYGSHFTVNARGMQVRPASEESLNTIATLRADIERLDKEAQDKRKELRELCN